MIQNYEHYAFHYMNLELTGKEEHSGKTTCGTRRESSPRGLFQSSEVLEFGAV
jgi:hypothetical protein